MDVVELITFQVSLVLQKMSVIFWNFSVNVTAVDDVDSGGKDDDDDDDN